MDTEVMDEFISRYPVVPASTSGSEPLSAYPVADCGSSDAQQRCSFCDGEFLWGCHGGLVAQRSRKYKGIGR